jgi:hypothetical protein
MLLTFAVALCLTLPFLLRRVALRRRVWAGVSVLALSASLVLSFVSVWSVWTPYVTSRDLHDGEFEGCFPLSKLSYPLYLSVYHTPSALLLYDGLSVSGNVSFSAFLASFRLLKVEGGFSYSAIFGWSRLQYSLDFPFFNDGPTFFLFILAFFTVLNAAGAALGILLAYALAKERARLT